jgi:thiol:disulfide interchange protein DsbG
MRKIRHWFEHLCHSRSPALVPLPDYLTQEQFMSFIRRPRGAAVFVFCLTLVMAAPAFAANTDKNASKPDTAELPKILQQSVKAGKLTVIKKFKTAKPGLTGYVIQQSGQHEVVYGEDGFLIVGQLISPDGDNLSAQYTQQYVPKPDVAKVVSDLRKTGHLVQQGPDDAPVLYVFADPNCIYCHRFYDQVAPLAKAGKIQVKWALAGFLKPSSMGRAAAILSADDPTAALAKNEAGFNEAKEEGGIKPVDSPNPKLETLINLHYKQMAAAGGNGTPTVIYREGGPNQWAAKVGMPPKGWLESYIKSQDGHDNSQNNSKNDKQD